MDLSIFYQLSLVIALAAVVSLIARAFKQPLIIGYIVTGIIVGPSVLNLTGSNHTAFESFSEIGIVLLLFMIGLGLNTEVIKKTGKPVMLTFMAIVAGVGGTGYATAAVLGFKPMESLIIAIALLFSSTIIVVKSLIDKKEQSRLYGQIAIGILLVEDLAATVALLLVSTSAAGTFTFESLGWLALRGLGLTTILFLAGRYLMPELAKLFAQSQELLYMFALAWGFGVASLFKASGFSIEVGALFAGVALAHLTYAQEITTRLKPIRDFFLLIFFIELGQKLGLTNISSAWLPALAFSAIIMVTKPLLTLISLGVLGYTKQTGFKAAVHLSQISEFSIILVVLAERMGVVGANVAVAITLTALITIVLSTYLMNYDDWLFRHLRKPLSVFERPDTKKELTALSHYPLILLGYQRGGHEFIKTFRKMKKPYIVVDYDPAVIDALDHQHINHIYGDATDLELLDELGVHQSELIISTIADTETNLLMLTHIHQRNKRASFICHAASYEEAEALYAKGAAFVIMYHFLGSEQVNHYIRTNGSSKHAFEKYRQHQKAAAGNSIIGGQ
jgi:Kef-type K+ transport system membrane component KefB